MGTMGEILEASCRRVSFGYSDKINSPNKTKSCNRAVLVEMVEGILHRLGPEKRDEKKYPVPVETVLREIESTLVLDENERLDRSLLDDLIFIFRDAGAVDYNRLDYAEMQIISSFMWTRGCWKFDSRYQSLWLWEWDDVYPGQCCANCGVSDKPLAICSGCKLSHSSNAYCSRDCQSQDWPNHQSMCLHFQKNGPAKQS